MAASQGTTYIILSALQVMQLCIMAALYHSLAVPQQL
jgi:hypothetical protein